MIKINRTNNIFIPAFVVFALIVLNVSMLPAQDSEGLQKKGKGKYVCPPCGQECDKILHDKPGSCGDCGMKFVLASSLKSGNTVNRQSNSQAARQNQRNRKKVAVLIFDGVQIIDYTGPWEIFGGARFNVFSVSRSTDMIRTTYGMKVTPDYTLDNHPQPDIILVPGGNVGNTQRDPEVLKWLNSETANKAEVILSVCNGAYIIAKAGLLKGLKATTTRHLVDGLANAGPDITVVRNVRFVDNGKIVTAGGLSAGMDAALHVVSRFLGQQRAERVAYGIEYDWKQK